MEFICTAWQTNKVPIPTRASFHPSPASHEHHSHHQHYKHVCLQVEKPTEDQRNHLAKLCAMAWAMATTGRGIFSNKGCEQACKNYILKQLGLFPGIDISVYWVLKIQFRNTADSHLVPFINIIKYQFHSFPTSTPIRTFSHRLKSTWNRILKETDNATWLLGHLGLWGIFLLTPRCSSISHALLMNIDFSGPRLIWMPPCYYHLHASSSAPATKHWAQHKRKLEDCSNSETLTLAIKDSNHSK